MIKVRDFRDFVKYVANFDDRVSMVFCVDDETEFSKKVKEVAEGDLIVIAVYPNADMAAYDEDNVADVDATVLYVLKKMSDRDVDEEDLMDERELTQNVMTDLRERLLEIQSDHDDPFHNIAKRMTYKQHIDRERNFMQCNGYSVSLNFKTITL